MSDDFSEYLSKEEENVCFVDDHVRISLVAFLEGCVQKLRERIRWHVFFVSESSLDYGVDGERGWGEFGKS